MTRFIPILFLLFSFSLPLAAAENMEVDAYAGAVSLLGYDGGQAGLRLTWPLQSWLRVGVDMSTELDLSRTHFDGRVDRGSFLRAHVLLKLSKQFKGLEPYVIGSLGKDLVGENPLPYSPENIEKQQWFDSQPAAGFKVGLAYRFSRFKIGAEAGGGSTGTGYEDYNLVFGITF